jgi:hypothetical protein
LIPVVGNIIPGQMVQFYEAVQSGRLEDAELVYSLAIFTLGKCRESSILSVRRSRKTANCMP